MRESPAAERLTPPAFAKSLLALRMAGFHPLMVNVQFGNDWAPVKAYADRAREAQARKVPAFSAAWRELAGDPWIAVSPRQYLPGEVDFRVVAGSMVTLHDPEGALAQWQPEFGTVYDLVAELSRWAVTHVQPAAGEAISASMLAQSFVEDLSVRPVRWPRWWSDQQEEEHDVKFRQWAKDSAAYHRLRSAA
jgi:hypothetical protein